MSTLSAHMARLEHLAAGAGPCPHDEHDRDVCACSDPTDIVLSLPLRQVRATDLFTCQAIALKGGA